MSIPTRLELAIESLFAALGADNGNAMNELRATLASKSRAACR